MAETKGDHVQHRWYSLSRKHCTNIEVNFHCMSGGNSLRAVLCLALLKRENQGLSVLLILSHLKNQAGTRGPGPRTISRELLYRARGQDVQDVHQLISTEIQMTLCGWCKRSKFECRWWNWTEAHPLSYKEVATWGHASGAQAPFLALRHLWPTSLQTEKKKLQCCSFWDDKVFRELQWDKGRMCFL